MNHELTARWTLVIVLSAAILGGCGSGSHDATCSQAIYSPQIVAADFVSAVDNKYLSYLPGTVLRYVDTDKNVVEQDVLADTKTLLGVKVTVVHDFSKTESGQLLEDTYDYFAQDKAGNVWYFGEDTKAYSGTMVSTAGSWAAGEGCAQPGIVMRGNPQVGDSYRQEYRAGEAEDEADIVSVTEKVTVPYGTFEGCVKTREHTALAPGDVENKYYCPGAGEVLAVDIGTIDQGKREELLTINGKSSAP
jgi:hypothetical protein